MRRVLRLVLVWLAALSWAAGWGVHAGMAIAQSAGATQICFAGERGVLDGPANDARLKCSACAQALSAAADSAIPDAGAFVAVAASERLSTSLAVRPDRTRRFSAHAPRAPPLA